MMPARSESDRVVPSGRGRRHASGTGNVVDTMSGTGGDDAEGVVASGLYVVEEGGECWHSSAAQLGAVGEAQK